MKNKYISYDKFLEILNNSTKITSEEIIKTHKKLIGVKDSSQIHQGDLGFYYIYRILDHNYGKNKPIETPHEYHKFLNSKYLSNYFKELINQKIDNKTELLETAINSNRTFNELTEEEIYEIYIKMSEISIGNLIIAYATHLDSPSAKNFLNKRINPIILLARIISTSGLNPRPEYYSGRGTNLGDLNSNHILSIYKKLKNLDEQKALNMLKLTFNMPTLGATEFLQSLYNLACNKYKFDESIISDNNISLGQSQGTNRENTAIATFTSYRTNSHIGSTNNIKKELKEQLPEYILRKIKIYDSCDYEDYSYPKIRKKGK